MTPTTPTSHNIRRSSVLHTHVTLSGTFWAERQRVNRERTIPHIYEQCRTTGRVDALVGNWPQDVREGGIKVNFPLLFWDSDIAKWIEAASFSLASHPNPELDALVDEVIVAIGKGQLPDGYLNSWFGHVETDKRWTNMRDWHELYDAGHLIEAAVAHFQSTGKRSLLEIVCRYADYIGSVFGREPGKRRGYCGHPEVELALVKLARATGEQRYMDMARYFVDERGQQPHYFDQEAIARGSKPSDYWFKNYEYSQSHCPVRDQHEVVGHAVRAMYLYSAMADLAAEDGDASLLEACQRLWTHLTTKRMYVMGGIGSSKDNEGFTSDYDLPNKSAYAETCAAIALVFWAQRMLEIELDSRYADVMELALYNAVLSGVSLEGTHFFYDNPLASDGGHHRQEWFHCPCCPPNLSRIFSSLGGYVYAQGQDDVAVHLYAAGEARLSVAGRDVTLRQETSYPWDGAVSLTVGLATPASFGLRLRIPAWCAAPSLRVNGQPVDLAASVECGYALIQREWRDGDVVTLDLPMSAQRVYAHPDVSDDVASVAIQRGPLVYCLEQADHETPIRRIRLPADAELTARFDAELLGGVVVVEATASALADAGWEGALYRAAPPALVPCALRAIPYYTWDNREAGAMTVWVRE